MDLLMQSTLEISNPRRRCAPSVETLDKNSGFSVIVTVISNSVFPRVNLAIAIEWHIQISTWIESDKVDSSVKHGWLCAPFHWLRCNSVIGISLYSSRLLGSIMVSFRRHNRSEILLLKNRIFSQHVLGSRIGAHQRSYPSNRGTIAGWLARSS